MSVACRPHLQAQLGREARADWVEVLVRETMARKVTAVATTDHRQRSVHRHLRSTRCRTVSCNALRRAGLPNAGCPPRVGGPRTYIRFTPVQYANSGWRECRPTFFMPLRANQSARPDQSEQESNNHQRPAHLTTSHHRKTTKGDCCADRFRQGGRDHYACPCCNGRRSRAGPF